MKNFLLTIIALLSISSMYAENDYLYIEDFEVKNDRLYAVVPIKAHFDSYVSGFQVELTLPEGLTITHAEPGTDLYIDHFNQLGITVEYYPFVGVSARHTKYLVSSWEMDYDNGNPVGVAKYAPGDYVFFELNVDVTMDFKGGSIQVKSICCSGADSRPWVNRCHGCTKTTTTHVSVAGVEPDPEEPESPYQGYWIIADGDTINIPRKIYVDLREYNDDYKYSYHFIIDGISYGAQHEGTPTSLEVEDNILIPTSTNNYTLDGGMKYLITVWNGIPHLVFLTPMSEPNNGGADAVDETADDRQVKDIRYYDIQGREMKEPNGITIVVTTYTDGSHNSAKILQR